MKEFIRPAVDDGNGLGAVPLSEFQTSIVGAVWVKYEFEWLVSLSSGAVFWPISRQMLEAGSRSEQRG